MNTLKDKPSSKIMASSHKTWPKTSPCFQEENDLGLKDHSKELSYLTSHLSESLMPSSIYGVRGQSLIAMPESAKLTIKFGDEERKSGEENIASDIDVSGSRAKGSADLRQGLPCGTAFVSPYNRSTPLLHASSAPPILVFRHSPEPSYLASCFAIGTRL
jgi:hypothetical protein